MAGEVFDLGNVLRTAESIKAARRQPAEDLLRQRYLESQISNSEQSGRIQGEQAARQKVLGEREDAAYSAEQQLQNTRTLHVAASQVAADPSSISKWEPILKQSGVLSQDLDLSTVPPELLQRYAGDLAKKAQTELQSYLSTNPAMMEADYKHRQELERIQTQGAQQLAVTAAQGANAQALADKGHGYDMAEINARGAQDRATAGVSAPAKTRVEAQKLRKEFEGLQSVQNYRAVEPLVKSAQNAPDTGYGDLDMIYAVGKILDPASVVREGELALVLDAGSPLQKILGKTRFNFEKGGRITPKQRQQLMGMIQGRAGAVKEAYEREVARFGGYAQEAGLEPGMVVGEQGAQPQQPGNRRVKVDAQGNVIQ